MPVVWNGFAHEVRDREFGNAALLAIGAVAAGAFSRVSGHFPYLAAHCELETICHESLKHPLDFRRLTVPELFAGITRSSLRNNRFDIESIRLDPRGSALE